MEVDVIYLILAILGIGVLSINLIISMIGLDFLDFDNSYLIKIFFSSITGIGLGGLKWGIIGAVNLGFIFGALIAIVIYIIMSLKKEDIFDRKDLIGTVCTVSMHVGPDMYGKVLVPVRGAMTEIEALSNVHLNIGDSVKIIDLSGESLVIEKYIREEK